MDNIERVKQVKFELYCKELNRKGIDEPEGWNEDFLSFERDKDSKDIRRKVEIDLNFYGSGSSYLQTLYYGHGAGPICFIIKYEKSVTGLNETWDLAYIQKLDLTTFDIDKDTGAVKVKAHEGGLYDLIKNRYDDEVDLLDEYSLDGDYIGPLKTYPFQPTERKIFLKTLLEGDYDRYRIGTGYWESAVIYSGRPVPFDIVFKSDGAGDIQQPTLVNEIYNDGRDRSAPADPTIGYTVGSDMPLFFEAEETKEIRVKASVTFQLTEFEDRFVEGTPTLAVRFIKSYKAEDGEQKVKEFDTLIEIPIYSNINVEHTVELDKTVTLEKDESLSLIYVTEVAIDSTLNPFKNGYANTFVNSKATISLFDLTSYPPQVGRCIKPKDLFDRIVAKITGKVGLLRSDVFGEGGEMEYKVVDNGFFARGFPDKYTDADGAEIAIQFKTSFKEAYQAFEGITPMCWLTQKEGNKEIVRIEPDTYSMQNFEGITLEAADEISEKCSAKDLFSKIELGHEGDLEYEEVNGLDEPNGKSSFATHLGASVNNTYSKLSPYRYDSQGYELTRRVFFAAFPYKDTSRDEDKWIHDAKLVNNIIMHRLWQEDFDAAPKGIFDPDSAWNLRHSPMNLLLGGHGRSVRRCLYHDESKFIRFAASNANQNLITYPQGIELREGGEDGKIQIGSLKKQRIKADTITMTIKVTQELRKQLEGYNENGVKNIFGLIAYPEKGVKKYGRLVKLTSGETSKLELIKAGI